MYVLLPSLCRFSAVWEYVISYPAFLFNCRHYVFRLHGSGFQGLRDGGMEGVAGEAREEKAMWKKTAIQSQLPNRGGRNGGRGAGVEKQE